MNVIISAGGRFHAFRLAQQLNRFGKLHTLFTFDYTKSDHAIIPQANVHSVTSCKLFNQLITRLQLTRFIDKNRLNIIKDNAFDYLVSKQLQKNDAYDLFVVWAHYGLKSMPVARARNAKIIVESGSCHIQAQEALLQEEFQCWGLKAPPIDQRIIDKMCAEYDHADYIMTLSRFARQSFLSRGFKSEKILMAPCGVDVEFFHNQARKPEPTFRVIFTGLVTLRKGVQHLIQAWHMAKLPAQSTELIIVGTMHKDFRSILSTLPLQANIRFTGPTSKSKLKSLYEQSSLFVLPSIEDGFGMVIGEAMASGLPVICSTNTAGPDLINDGEHGFIIKPGAVAMLAEKIRWCYEYREQAFSMGLKGLQRINGFTWNHYGDKVYTLYQQILKT